MTIKPIQPIAYDTRGTIGDDRPLGEKDLAAIAPFLDNVRQEFLLTDLELFHEKPDEIPDPKRPLDAGFFELPQKLLAEYQQHRDASELGRILHTAARLRETVDNVVVLGIGGSYMGARAMMDACCHPYHNQLGRAERGSVPRVFFAGNNLDNDAAQGLLDVLGRGRPPKTIDERWAIVVVSKSGGTLETAAAFRIFLRTLQQACGGDEQQVAELVVPVTGTTGKLFELSRELGCPDVFHVPDGVGGRFSVLSAVGLLPAAVMGLDVVRLLEGATAMNERFRNDPQPENIVLKYVAVCHLLEAGYNIHTRVLSTWGDSLEAVGLWYDQLLAESLGKHELGALPLTVVNTRDLHSRGQQHQEGRRDKMFTNLVIDNIRRDALAIGHSELNQDELNEMAEKTLPELLTAALRGTNAAYHEVNRPTADIHLPLADEAALGQLFQMLMIATVVEGRLIQINPYGQPGVEAYKKNMGEILQGKKT